jgi:hypothetical protein
VTYNLLLFSSPSIVTIIRHLFRKGEEDDGKRNHTRAAADEARWEND